LGAYLKKNLSFLYFYRIPIGLFLFLILQAATLGLSDDEAYYWVLAQKPALSYGFHPPAVAWLIALFSKVFGQLLSSAPVLLTRLPAIVCVTLVFGMSLGWLFEVGKNKKLLAQAPWVLLSFSGFFALSWMMVPDGPLFLGWTLCFVSTWRICFGAARIKHLVLLACSCALLMVSKYSGVLAVFSAFSAIFLWGRPERKTKALGAIILGLIAGLVPIVIWNWQHEWASLLYQIRDRHAGGHVSLWRWLKFWLIEAVFAGPPLIGYFFVMIRKVIRPSAPSESVLMRFLMMWIAPAALVFCVQPLFADFKPHWAFIVWWPVVLGLAAVGQNSIAGDSGRWTDWQVRYGFILNALVLVTLHLPWIGWLVPQVSSKPYEITWDVTNDLFGWSHFKEQVTSVLSAEDLMLPVVGSRYQTASQAAFHLAHVAQVTFIPREQKEWDEWLDLGVSDSFGPDWPRLTRSVLFIADNRYSEGPGFSGAACKKLHRFFEYRIGILAKWIDVWRCNPT
jgi:dolichol-phosphate mannosyltransferase